MSELAWIWIILGGLIILLPIGILSWYVYDSSSDKGEGICSVIGMICSLGFVIYSIISLFIFLFNKGIVEGMLGIIAFLLLGILVYLIFKSL